MAQYTAETIWLRGDQDFLGNRYSRRGAFCPMPHSSQSTVSPTAWGYEPNRVVIEVLESSIERESDLEDTIQTYRGITNMLHNCKCLVLAEGVETRNRLQALASVVVPQLGNQQSVLMNLADNPVLFIDPPGPVA